MSTRVSETLRARLTKSYFKPSTWAFWRALIFCFIICNLIGHWLEIPYCNFMSRFGIVDPEYAALNDPWYVPYFVYGLGAFAMTMILEPLKERFLARRKTIAGAVLETFFIMMFISMVLELTFGLIVNQPDANGVYPYWDNSQLPLNVGGQAWLVNDFFIGLMASVYVWLIFPAVNILFEKLPKPRISSNAVIGATLPAFAVSLVFSVPYF